MDAKIKLAANTEITCNMNVSKHVLPSSSNGFHTSWSFKG